MVVAFEALLPASELGHVVVEQEFLWFLSCQWAWLLIFLGPSVGVAAQVLAAAAA